jgi:hypothetical protein
MGAVFDTKDLARDRKKIFRNAVKDLSPDTRARIVKIFESWKGPESEQELEEILGSQNSKKFRELFRHSVGDLNSNDEEILRRLFRESLTFD